MTLKNTVFLFYSPVGQTVILSELNPRHQQTMFLLWSGESPLAWSFPASADCLCVPWFTALSTPEILTPGFSHHISMTSLSAPLSSIFCDVFEYIYITWDNLPYQSTDNYICTLC